MLVRGRGNGVRRPRRPGRLKGVDCSASAHWSRSETTRYCSPTRLVSDSVVMRAWNWPSLAAALAARGRALRSST